MLRRPPRSTRTTTLVPAPTLFRSTAIRDCRLVGATTPTNQRPDLGIGGDDVAIDKHGVTLTVHSLGARPVAGGTARLEAADGRVLATAPIAALAAPIDLEPKTVAEIGRAHV